MISRSIINLENRLLKIKSKTFNYLVLNVCVFFRMELKTFACYDNFVPSNNCGAPDHTPNHSALLHLERLLQSLTLQIRHIARTESKEVIFLMNPFDGFSLQFIIVYISLWFRPIIFIRGCSIASQVFLTQMMVLCQHCFIKN